MQRITEEVLATLESHEGFGQLETSLKELIIEQVAKLSEMDMLTNTANRSKVLGVIESEWARSIRYHSPVSLIMFDIDGLQAFNESHGYDVGDEIMLAITGVIEKNIRTTDLLGRFGDDEFILVVPTTNNEQAAWLADKLSHVIKDTLFMSVGRVSCTFGIADRDDALDVEDWIRIVEVALTHAKAQGKGSVVDYESIAHKDL